MTTDSTRAKLDDRYGRTSARTRRVRWIVIGTIAALLVGYVGWSTIARTLNTVDYDTTGFHDVDDNGITVDFQVTSRPDTAFVCAIEAQDSEHGVVGWRVVEYPADPAHTRRFSERVPTTALATTGLVTSCWIP
jgi:hypothetical protein